MSILTRLLNSALSGRAKILALHSAIICISNPVAQSHHKSCPITFCLLRHTLHRGFPGGSVVKTLPANAGDVSSILGGGEDPLEKEMAIHFSITAWRIPRTEEPGGLQSRGCRVRYHWATKQQQPLSKCLAGRKRSLRYSIAYLWEKAMAPHSSTLAWKILWTVEPGALLSMGSLGVGHNWATSLSLFTFMHWRRKWQPTPVFLPRESQGRGSLVGCRLWGRTESDTTDAT